MVVEFVSVCLFVHVQTRLYVVSLFHSTNDTTYLTHNKYVKVCGIFSETAPLQSYIELYSCNIWPEGIFVYFTRSTCLKTFCMTMYINT